MSDYLCVPSKIKLKKTTTGIFGLWVYLHPDKKQMQFRKGLHDIGYVKDRRIIIDSHEIHPDYMFYVRFATWNEYRYSFKLSGNGNKKTSNVYIPELFNAMPNLTEPQTVFVQEIEFNGATMLEIDTNRTFL